MLYCGEAPRLTFWFIFDPTDGMFLTESLQDWTKDFRDAMLFLTFKDGYKTRESLIYHAYEEGGENIRRAIRSTLTYRTVIDIERNGFADISKER